MKITNEIMRNFYTFEGERYTSPDSHNYASFSEWAEDNEFETDGTPQDLVNVMDERGFVALPVWNYRSAYYDAALTNPFHNSLGSKMVGIIYAAKEDLKKDLGLEGGLTSADIQRIKDYFRNQVRDYYSYPTREMFSAKREYDESYRELDYFLA
jgi:hypothetical protein